MKYFLPLLLSVFGFFGLSAQNFSLDDTLITINTDLSASFPKKAATRINILSGSQLSMQWEEVGRNVPAQWVIFVCDPDACRDTTSRGETFNIPGQFGRDFYASINPLGVAGVGELWYDLWDVNDDENKVRFHVVMDVAVGIEEELAANWTMAPNPSMGQTVVKWTHPGFVGGTLSVLDLQGKSIQDYSISGAQGQFSIDTHRLQPGLYFVQFSSPEGVRLTHKLLVN